MPDVTEAALGRANTALMINPARMPTIEEIFKPRKHQGSLAVGSVRRQPGGVGQGG
jgi:hypothetical protein